jgi:hypothetical protein
MVKAIANFAMDWELIIVNATLCFQFFHIWNANLSYPTFSKVYDNVELKVLLVYTWWVVVVWPFGLDEYDNLKIGVNLIDLEIDWSKHIQTSIHLPR